MSIEDESTLPPSRPAHPPLTMQPSANAILPPHPLDKRWFAHVDGTSYGPYTGHQIKQMISSDQIRDSDFLCPEGGNAWTQAKSDPLLGALFRKREPEPQPSNISENTGTIVQVTNNIPNNNAVHAALLLSGAAAPKSPGVALLLSFLICGVGQMYNGQVGKGFLMLIGCVALWFALLGWIVWIWAMVDAYTTAKEMNLRYQQLLVAGLK